MANPWEMSYEAPGPWTLDYEPTEADVEEILSRPALPAWEQDLQPPPAKKGFEFDPFLALNPVGTAAKTLLNLADLTSEQIRNTKIGHSILGPTDAEKEAGVTPYNDPGIVPIAKKMLEFTSVPPPVREEIRTLTDPALETPLLGQTGQGIAKGLRELAITTPLAPFGKAGAAALPLFGAEYAQSLPEQKAAYKKAIEEGRFADAAQIATGVVGGGLLLAGAAGHELSGKPTIEGEPNARRESETSQLHENVRPQPREGVQEMPVKEGGERVQPSEEAPKEEVPQLQRDLSEDAAAAEKESGWTIKKSNEFGGAKLEDLPPDLAEQMAKLPKQLEVTDRRAGSATEGSTVYVPENATTAEITERIRDNSLQVMLGKLTGNPPFESSTYKGTLGNDLTGFAYDLGSLARTTEEVGKFQAAYESLSAKAKEAMKAGDFGKANDFVRKAQAAHEAYQAATGVNVKGEPAALHLIRKSHPDYKPPVPPETPPTPIETETIPAYEKGVAATGTSSLFIDPFFYEAGIKPLGRAAKAAFDSPVAQKLRTQMEDIWNAVALKSAPKLTRSKRELGEAGVRYASSHMVGRTKGQIFADKVLADSGIDPVKFGTALAEDNLRSIRESRSPEEAAKVQTLIGDETSPFKTEQEYQDFLNDPATQAAIDRHKQLWAEQKDPIYRQANDLDPDLPLETRGLQTGARINLKALQPEEAGVAPVGRPRALGFRQLATLKRRDPFGKKATGAGQAYEGHYHEIMANGFERELPVAKQHEFLKQLIDNGDAVVSDKMREPELQLKGEGTDKGYLLTLKPWTGKFLHVRQGLRPEFESISGLVPSSRLPIITAFNDFMTKQSVAGLAEGTTHASNLMTQIFTMPGPTANPMLNALVKSLGRVDLLYSIPRVLIKGFSNQRERMLELAEIGAAKEPYPGAIAKKILNPIDQGVRLVSDDVYKGLAEKGIVENNETARREFVNQVGQYNKALQPMLTRKLRETGINPFITAGQTFNAQGLRRLALGPGVKATSNARALALKADVAAGWLGAIVLVTALNKIVSGNAAGPAGTPLGAVGWVGDDKKVHNFNLMRLLGYERGLRVTGIGPAIQAKRLGLSTQQAAKAGGESVASTGLSMLAGPGPRAAVIASTGVRPTQPWVKEVETVPPTDSMSPLKTQMAANIQKAIEEANPILSSAATMRDELKRGKSVTEASKEAVYKQATRYTPKTGMSEQTVKALPKIVDTRQLRDYVEGVAKEARKLPINERRNYIRKRFNEDELGKKYRDPAWAEVEKRGVLRYR